MNVVQAAGYELAAHWVGLVMFIGVPCLAGKMVRSDTWDSGDNCLFFGSTAVGLGFFWLVLASLGHVFGIYLSRAFS